MKKINNKKNKQLKNIGTATALTVSLSATNISTLAYAVELEKEVNLTDIIKEQKDLVAQEQEIKIPEQDLTIQEHEITTQEELIQNEEVIEREISNQEEDINVQKEDCIEEDIATQEELIDVQDMNNQSTIKNFDLNNWEYRVFNSTNTIVLDKYKARNTDIVIPGEIEGKSVKIANIDCFSEINSTLTSIVFKVENGKKVQTPASLANMFSNSKNLKSVDLSGLDTSTVTSMASMFMNCTNLTSITFGEQFDTSKVANMASMFRGCSSLTSLDLSKFNTSKVSNMAYMFKDVVTLGKLDLSSFNTQKVTDMRYMFDGCKSLESIDLSSFNTDKVQHMRYMFNACQSLKSLNLSNFNTSLIDNMDNMFRMCSSLTSLDLSNFDTSKVTSVTNLFIGCSKLTNIDLSNFNTSNVTKMNNMFKDCTSLTKLDISHFDTSKVTDMSYMFSDTSINNLNLNSFDTLSVTTMQGMFRNTKNLKSISFGAQFNTANVTDMSFMFCNTGLNDLNLSNFDTSQVTNMRGMFALLNNMCILDLSSFNLSNISEDNIKYMFAKNIVVEADGTVIENTSINNAKSLLIVSKDSKLINYNYAADACLPVGPVLYANGGKFANGEEIYLDFKIYVIESLYNTTIELYDKISTSIEPTRGGHTFISWESDSTTLENKSLIDRLNTVYYAKWHVGDKVVTDNGTIIKPGPTSGTPEADKDGNVIVPDGGIVVLPDGKEIMPEAGSKVTPNGDILAPEDKKDEINTDKDNPNVDTDSSITPDNNGNTGNNTDNNTNNNDNTDTNTDTNTNTNTNRPQTGDNGLLGFIGLGLASGVGLFINNRKKKPSNK